MSHGRTFWVTLVVGWGVMAYALRGVFVDDHFTHPDDLAKWLVGSALVHDLVVAPAVLVVGWVVHRWVPAQVRGPVQLGLFASGVMALFAYPFVRGYGDVPSNPSALPRDYTEGLLLVLATIWAAVAVAIAAAGARRWLRPREPR